MKRVSARGFVLTEKGLAVIFRRKIKDGKEKEYYVVPGGGIEDGEDIIDGLKRELKEELNLEVEVQDLAFIKETEERIEYFYLCKYLSGDFRLNGEELERMSEQNYYEPTFLKLEEIDQYDIMPEVKNYFKEH